MQKFVAEMVYGMTVSESCKLTEIGRALNEEISIKKTVDRLGRNLKNFSGEKAMMENYLSAVRPSLGDSTMLLIDPSDVAKPCSPKMEAIGSVYDASDKKFVNGYWTLGVAALTEENHQPIPVYEELYPCKKQGGLGLNAEMEKALQYLREHFDKSVPRVCDRGLDSGDIIKEFDGHDEKFIIRVNQNRVAVHGGKRTKINNIVRGLDCQLKMEYRGKDGEPVTCKIGMTRVTLPKVGNVKLNLVVCKEYGENPLALYTNLDESVEEMAVRIVKMYLMRWRIDELYGVKKQRYNFEDFRVRSLECIKKLDLLLTVAAGYAGTLAAKVNTDAFVADLICISKRVLKYADFVKTTKLFYYAILDGITCVLNRQSSGISHFFVPTPVSRQLCFQLP
jgi:hypothetical protein